MSNNSSKDTNTCQLIRTNPRYGNVKLVVDDTGIYMDSLNDKGVLATEPYKAVRLFSTGKYAKDVGDYLRNVTNDDIYNNSVGGVPTVGSEYSDQRYNKYENSVRIDTSGYYKNPYSLLAPLWINKTVPDYFVVFSLPGPYDREDDRTMGSLEPMVPGKYYTSNDQFSVNGVAHPGGSIISVDVATNDWISASPMIEMGDVKTTDDFESLVKNAKIVKVFNIKQHDIGEYLYNHINDGNYDHAPVNVDFKNKRMEYHGIDISSGTMAYINEYLDDSIYEDNGVVDFDEYVIDGYKRHRIIIPNLINIEFNFDDDVNEELTYNRYFGLYINFKDLYETEIDTRRSSSWRSFNSDGNLIPISGGPTITDENGITIGFKQSPNNHGFLLSAYDPLTFYAIKKNSGIISLLNNESSDDTQITLKDTSIAIGDIRNIASTPNKPVIKTKIPGKNSMIISIRDDYQFGYGDSVTFIMGTDIYDFIADYLPNAPGAYDSSNHVGHFFNPDNPVDGIIGSINEILEHKQIIAGKIDNNTIAIQSTINGNKDGYLELYDYDPNAVTLLQDFIGGNIDPKSRVLVPMLHMDGINVGDYIDIGDQYAPILSISSYLDEPIVNALGEIISYQSYGSYMVLTVDDKYDIDIVNGTVVIANDPRLLVGILDIVPVRDFMFDTNPERYDAYEQEYKKYFNAETIIKSGSTYRVVQVKAVDNFMVSYDGVDYPDGGTFVGVAGQTSVTGITGTYVIIDTKYENDDELSGFRGFYKPFRDISFKDGIQYAYNYFISKGTEYTRLREDINPDYELLNKLEPTINQWRMVDGLDVRNNPYRLNLSVGVGVNNFTPSFDISNKEPNSFTHEWYYLVGQPNYPNPSNDNELYLFRNNFDINEYTNTYYDYFSNYLNIRNFNYIDPLTGDNVTVPTWNRNAYSTIKKDENGNYYTMFRGTMLKFQSNTDLTGYKFSAILQIVNNNQYQNTKPISITQYINEDYCNIIVVIEVSLDDYKVAGNSQNYYEYSYLYMMNSLKSVTNNGDYKFGKKYDYPTPLVTRQLLNPDNSTQPSGDSFYGVQLYNKSLYQQSGSPFNIVFDDYIPIIDQIASFEDGVFPRLLVMNQAGFFGITQIGGKIDDDNHYINGVSSFIGFNGNNGVILDNNGMFISQLPTTKLGISYNPTYVGNTVYPPVTNSRWFIDEGGQNHYGNISKMLSAARMMDNLENNNDGVLEKYTISGGVLSQSDLLVVPVRPDKVDILNKREARISINNNFTSYSIDITTTDKKTSLYRYSGVYMPYMYDVLKFRGKDFLPTLSSIDTTWLETGYPWVPVKPTSSQKLKVWAVNGGGSLWTSHTKGLWVTKVSDGVIAVGDTFLGNNNGVPILEEFSNGNFTFVGKNGNILNYHIRKVSTSGDHYSDIGNDNLIYPYLDINSMVEIPKQVLDNNYVNPDYILDYNNNGKTSLPGHGVIHKFTGGLVSFISTHINTIDDVTLIMNTQAVSTEKLSGDTYSINIDIKKSVRDYIKPLIEGYIRKLLYFQVVTDDYIESIIDNTITPNMAISNIDVLSFITDSNDEQVLEIVNDSKINLLNAGYRSTRSMDVDVSSINPIDTISGKILLPQSKLTRLSIRISITNRAKNT